MNVTIRPYLPSDRESLRTLTVEAFQGVSIDHAIDIVLGPLSPIDWRRRKAQHVDDDIDHPKGELAVVDRDGEPLGYVSMRFDREGAIGTIPNLVVAPALRNLGWGRRLLLHALDRFKAEGMKIAKIETLEHNPIGRHLYPSVGFEEVARQIHYAIRID
ncbi:MAG: GNAT family N-acetyltransferase [Isosphaeraceae bacterium]|nr:GNAT family N-acetyltransferase [Isosphaeraceae bacterium]